MATTTTLTIRADGMETDIPGSQLPGCEPCLFLTQEYVEGWHGTPQAKLDLTELAMDAGATTTQNAHVYEAGKYAVPFGASLGPIAWIECRQASTNDTWIGAGQSKTVCEGQFTVPTDRIVRADLTVCCWAMRPTTIDWLGSGYVDWSIDGKWYYLTDSGAMATGWVQDGGKWYYLDPDSGAMHAADVESIGGKWYAFGDSGEMQYGVGSDASGALKV